MYAIEKVYANIPEESWKHTRFIRDIIHEAKELETNSKNRVIAIKTSGIEVTFTFHFSKLLQRRCAHLILDPYINFKKNHDSKKK